MTFHEFGKENDRVIVLIHPSLVMWDYFEYVVPELSTDFRVIVPALPGYDPDNKSDFTSVERIAEEIVDYLVRNYIDDVFCVYGCSMGGAIVIRMLTDIRIQIRNAVIDGGITPYRLPWIITRFIALKDFIVISMGKLGGIKLLQKFFATDELSEEDIRYEAEVLKMVSYKTIWRTFDSCNNYKMPEVIKTGCRNIRYWFADKEEKERKADIAYVKEKLPRTVFEKIENVGHGGMAPFKPELFIEKLRSL
ncbi:MAG: alpha/beta hydrolase [Clostridiales bacterium]|nr:alpha/beta hydrolase [Clostridiales bacterium]